MKRVETVYICDLCRHEDKPDPFWLVVLDPPNMKGLDKHICPACVTRIKEAITNQAFK